MTWNYRIIEHDDVPEPWWGLHEVYYDDAGLLSHYTQNPCRFVGDSRDDLIATLERALADARERPQLKASALKLLLRLG